MSGLKSLGHKLSLDLIETTKFDIIRIFKFKYG